MHRKDPFVQGEHYHLYNRGNDKRSIFLSQSDYRRFELLLYVANSSTPLHLDNLLSNRHLSFADIFSVPRGKPLVSIGAWTLMPNHYHLLVKEVLKDGISTFMKKLGTGYSMYFNLKHKRSGGLFQGPFKSRHIDNDQYLRHLYGYLALNPLDTIAKNWQTQSRNHTYSKWRAFLETYEYSSFTEYFGKEDRPQKTIIDKEAFPNHFPDQISFKRFIDEYLSCREEIETNH